MVALPEIAFSLCRNPAVAVGLPVALGLASGLVAGEIRHERTGQPMKTVCPAHPAFSYLWTGMYGLMGYAAHLCVQSFDAAPTPQGTEDATVGLAFYYAQLAMSLIWAPLYVGGRMPKLALVDSLVLTTTATAMTVKMHDLNWCSTSPTWFLAPVCAWLGYTTFLNVQSVLNEEKAKPGH